ncbi:unnamed protein product [Paramecium octaurelia]|uniref:Arrestin C-terminal-like domain-containing protein n=1 Tax=Paramecium octaurelia TaxID=43137 RepID=A0A8S1ST57_PAROT|nr:unnamed protein product [Paramecium octaurelia]
MGNKSGSEFCGIMIRTEKQLYFAGDVVQGNIYLHIIKEGFRGKEVKLTILGKEKQVGKQDQVLEEDHMKEKIFFIKSQQWPIHLKMIILWLVHSYFLLKSISLQTYLEHVIIKMAFLQAIARVVSTSKSINDIKNKQKLFHRNKRGNLLRLQVDAVLKEEHLPLKQSRKNIYFPTEFLNFNYDIDNSNCKLDVDKVDSVFVNRLRLRSNSDSEHVLEFELNYQYHKGPQKGNKIQLIQKKDYQLQLINLKNPLQHPTPSILGNCVNSIYYLKVQPHYEGCSCCSPRPTVKISITVLAIPPKEYIQPLIQPENWNPQAFQPIIIQSNTQGQESTLNKNLQQMAEPMKN